MFTVEYNEIKDSANVLLPLYIRDKGVDELAVKVMKAIGARSKTDAVREALLAKLESARAQTSLLERLQPILDGVERSGCENRSVDMKHFMDELWGDG